MLIGRGALANWHDVAPDADAEFNRWHTAEHLPERVGVPGFLRGRRYRAADGETSPAYFILYETTDVSVLRSPAYLARLDDPTPWTARVSAQMTRTIRTAARVHHSVGRGMGGFALAVRLYPQRDADLAGALTAAVDGCLAAHPGLCGGHVLEADAAVTGVDTAERAIRQPPDEMVPWTVVAEGVSLESLAGAQAWLMARMPRGVEAEAGCYALQGVVSLCDV